MKYLRISFFLLSLLLTVNLLNAQKDKKKIRILLMGDSTTQGGKPIFETSIKELLYGQGLTEVEVVNVGRGGETAHSLISTGRYDSEIKDLGAFDFIFFRYGINDRIKRKPFNELFPDDMRAALKAVKSDFPKAKIILMTIIPFFKNEEMHSEVNDLIKTIADEEKIAFFDIYTPYFNKKNELGENSMTVRFVPLENIAQNYHELLKPYTKYVKWKDMDMVRVQTDEFDPLLGNVIDWYKDQHPNTTGYRFLADESVKYLLPLLKKRKMK